MNKKNKSWKYFKLSLCFLLVVTVIVYYLWELPGAQSIIEVSVAFILLANIFMLLDLIKKMNKNKKIQGYLQTI
ncbi:TPA: hypothetical protein ACSK5R_002350, partial [Listeria innocua]